MNRYKIIVAYDGTDFHGWQVQPSDITVASTLQKSFEIAFNRQVSIVGASRTDSGVHALGQTALCVSDLAIDVERIKLAWNNSLPNSILIRSLEKVSADFHVFAHVVSKTYYYHLFYKHPLPFVARYGWFWKFIEYVDFEKFVCAMDCFVGEHDFRSFCKSVERCAGEDDNQTVRTIDSISIERYQRFGMIRVIITSKGFLRYQIRRMIGAALDVARKPNVPTDFITYELENPSDQQEFTRAEGCGLCLRKIVYKKGFD